jgi:hypothetical protein
VMIGWSSCQGGFPTMPGVAPSRSSKSAAGGEHSRAGRVAAAVLAAGATRPVPMLQTVTENRERHPMVQPRMSPATVKGGVVIRRRAQRNAQPHDGLAGFLLAKLAPDRWRRC